jgi:hypothetical protein
LLEKVLELAFDGGGEVLLGRRRDGELERGHRPGDGAGSAHRRHLLADDPVRY